MSFKRGNPGCPCCGPTCSPCSLPTSGALRLYLRQSTIRTTDCAACINIETLKDLEYSAGTPNITGAGAGHWKTAAFQRARVSQLSCTGAIAWNRLVVACVAGKVEVWEMLYSTSANAIAETSPTFRGKLSPVNTLSTWDEVSCSPFELRSVWTYTYFGVSCSTLVMAQDAWIYIP